MPKTRVFRSGNSLAVRLPKDIAFPEGAEVEITREGNAIVLREPKAQRLAEWHAFLADLAANPQPEFLDILDMKPEWPAHRMPPGYVDPEDETK
jgi:antitoxin VapB